GVAPCGGAAPALFLPRFQAYHARLGGAMYQQNYNPAGSPLLSTLLAAIPILTLLYLIALHPHRDADGNRLLGISAPWAAFGGVVASFLIAVLVMQMPAGAALSAFVAGALNGAIGIVWIIVGAILLYTITLVS